jgi:branched-chain amino acid transport system substrate-binding protein
MGRATSLGGPGVPGWRRGLTAVAAATALVLAACGGGGGTTSSGGGGQSSTSSGAQPGSQANSEAITDYAAYTGSKPGKADASQSPVAIGWVNTQDGPVSSIPEATQGAQAAVKYLNDALGGVGGHPVQLRSCFTKQAEEEGQKCGQQLASDSSVSIIGFGAVSIGNQSIESVLNGAKPVVSGVSAAPSDSTAKNTYILYGDQTHVLTPWGTYGRDVLHAKTAAIFYPNQAGAQSGAAVTKKGIQDAGINVKSVGYSPDATDLLGPVTASGAQSADMIVPFTDSPGCVNAAKAMKQIGLAKASAIVADPLCLDPTVAKGLGGDLPKWTYGIAQTLPTDTTAADQKAYVNTSSQYGLNKASTANPYAALGWAQILTIAKFMNAVGPDKITPESMAAQVKAFKGPLIMGAPSIQCGKYPEAPAVCNDQTKFYTYEGKGVFKQVSGWLKPPKAS